MKKSVNKIIAIILFILYAVCLSFFISKNDFTKISTLGFCLISTVALYVLNNKFNNLVNNVTYYSLLAFVFSASLLGTTFAFYTHIKIYDDILHFTSGVLTGYIGVNIIQCFITKFKITNIPPILILLFAFFFTMGIASLWEITEFCADTFLKQNTQGGLVDSMVDMIDAFLGFGLYVLLFFKHKNVKKV